MMSDVTGILSDPEIGIGIGTMIVIGMCLGIARSHPGALAVMAGPVMRIITDLLVVVALIVDYLVLGDMIMMNRRILVDIDR